ncbi:MAG: hypothetical protein MI723_08765 [Caulobacterales bacterium]|nr:hypothetical protein [Caulobacterales bacterium]
MDLLSVAGQAAGYAFALVALTIGGNVSCRLVLRAAQIPLETGDEATLKTGRAIGALERLLLLAGLAANRWEVLVAVVALKSIARYKELETQIKAEYFLIGSLTSILWAVLIGGATLLYDQRVGWDIAGSILALQGR